MGHGLGQVQEEGLFRCRLTFDEVHRAQGQGAGQGGLVRIQIHELFPSKERQRRPSARGFRMEGPHVVGIGQTIELVKSMARGQVFRQVPQVPLAEEGGGIALSLQHLPKGCFLRRKPPTNAGPEGPIERQSVGIAAGQERRARSGANRLTHIEAGEAHPFPGQAVDVRSFPAGFPLAGQIPPAHVVHENDHDVGWLRLACTG